MLTFDGDTPSILKRRSRNRLQNEMIVAGSNCGASLAYWDNAALLQRRMPSSNARNVLVFPGGTEIGLEIQRSLSQCKDIRLYSAGTAASNHAPFVFARHFVVPSIHEPSWLMELNRLILEQKIDLVFPAHDDVVVALAENATRIHAGVVSSPVETCLITRAKSQTYKLFQGKLPVPELFDDVSEIVDYPIFVKPDRGQGSQGTHIAYDVDALRRLLESSKNLIALEYLPGDEYTIDCFTDREQGLLFCQGRQRVRTRSGIAMDSRPSSDAAFRQYAEVISSILPLHGAWFFQLKKDRNSICKLLEIGPRIAGTMALHRVKGVNFALLSIYEKERTAIKIMFNDMDLKIDRALINRYHHDLVYSAVYVDLDDTLLIDNRVNVNLARFLYQCINNNIPVNLLTKHAGDLKETLIAHRLTGLFDAIYQVEATGSKVDYIREHDAILIDDSFSERLAVNSALGIVTFDCSMLEMLIDDRR